MVPRTPFYAYTATLPYRPCNGKYDYVVYDKNTSAITINSASFSRLKMLITANQYRTKTGTPLFYNKFGPSTEGSSLGDDIYIDCQPTGGEGETLISKERGGSEGQGIGIGAINLGDNKVVQVLVAIGIMVAVYKGGIYAISKMSKPSQ